MKRLLILTAALLAGCGTPFGVSIGNFLESPANQAIVAFASKAAAASLISSLGGKANVNDTTRAAETVAAAAAINGISSASLSGIAALLRTKQATGAAANPVTVKAAATDAGVPNLAPAVAKAVTILAAANPGDNSNEAVAAIIDAVASKTKL